MKSGGAYISLNPNDPPERRSFQLLDSDPRLVVTTEDLAGHLSLDGRMAVRLDTAWSEISR